MARSFGATAREWGYLRQHQHDQAPRTSPWPCNSARQHLLEQPHGEMRGGSAFCTPNSRGFSPDRPIRRQQQIVPFWGSPLSDGAFSWMRRRYFPLDPNATQDSGFRSTIRSAAGVVPGRVAQHLAAICRTGPGADTEFHGNGRRRRRGRVAGEWCCRWKLCNGNRE